MRIAAMVSFRRLALFGAFGLALVGQAGPAYAAAFSVSPTRVVLTAQQTSALVTLTNDSERTVRFQLSVVAWDQTTEGQMKMSATSDVLVYPPMVSIAAHDSRRIRVGAVVPAAEVERSFRLFVEELPDEAELASGVRAVQVRTRMGIPVFLQGAHPTPLPLVEGFALRDGVVELDVLNDGTSFTVLQSVQIRGLADGREVFSSTAKGWYLLAKHRQTFRLPLDAAQCAPSKQLVLIATTDAGVVTRAISIAPSACVAR